LFTSKKYVHLNLEAYRFYGLQTPFLLVVLFGIYSILALVYGVITFRTVPEEAVALRQVPSMGEWLFFCLLRSFDINLEDGAYKVQVKSLHLQDIATARKDLQRHNIS